MANRVFGKASGPALLLIVLGGLGAGAWLWNSSVRRAETNFLPARRPAQWIVYPYAPDLVLRPRVEMSTIFKRSFDLEKAPSGAVLLSIAAFHWCDLSINGRKLPTPMKSGKSWKEPDQFNVSELLRI